MNMITGIISITLFIGGCSQRHYHPIQLEEKAESNINIRLLDRRHPSVPKDKFFYSKNWHYKQNIHNKYDFLRNDEIADTFYLAHHATRIYIRGGKHAIYRYKKYFLSHQLEAKILLIPQENYKRNMIRIDYFSLMKSAIIPNEKKGHILSVKNIIKANSDIVEIPKNNIKEI